jgi:CRP/FNR family transcriptional regulator, cyclic AMP receptor protein
MRDSFWYLKNCDLFSRLSPNDITELESQSRMKQLKRGEPVYLPHQLADGVLLVAKGRVKICHATPDGKQSILGFIDEGEIFGELSILGGERRDEYVETTEKTTLVLIPKQALQRSIQKYPDLVLGVTKIIGCRRQRIQRRLRNLLFRSNRERVIHLLLELAEKYAEPSPDGLLLNIRLSHQEMACIIGSTRETVTVVLGQLQKDEFLSIARRKIVLKDIGKLAAEVNERAPLLPHQRVAVPVPTPAKSFAVSSSSSFAVRS